MEKEGLWERGRGSTDVIRESFGELTVGHGLDAQLVYDLPFCGILCCDISNTWDIAFTYMVEMAKSLRDVHMT